MQSTHALIVGLACLLSACSMDEIMIDNIVVLSSRIERAVQRQQDVEQVREAMPALVVQLDGFIEAAPTNGGLLVQGAALHCLFALSFMEEESEPRALVLYEKGENYALRALDTVPGFTTAYSHGARSLAKFLPQLDTAAVPALFWAANCMALKLKVTSDLPQAAAETEKAELMMRRVLELDESFYWGGAHLFFGVNLARPKIVGGNLDQSKAHFDRMFQLTDSRYLLAFYYFAATYCVQRQDEKSFIASLQRILESDRSQDSPEMIFVNQLARRKAASLLKRREELFL